jgi:hypothetical protein
MRILWHARSHDPSNLHSSSIKLEIVPEIKGILQKVKYRTPVSHEIPKPNSNVVYEGRIVKHIEL